MAQEKLTVDEFRALAESMKSGGGMKRNKYGNSRTNGRASKKENSRAHELRLKLQAGLISGLREQVAFILIPAQVNEDGNMENPVSYIADFVYVDNETGKTVVEDTKGFRTKDYIIKRKLMLKEHGITIKEL